MSIKFLTISSFCLGFCSVASAASTNYLGKENLKIQPSVSVGGEYRSNLYLDEGEKGGGAAVVPGTAILVNPVFIMQADSSLLDLKLAGGYGARTFIKEELSNLNSFNDGKLSLNANFLPNSVVGFSVLEDFTSNNRPVNHQNAENALLRVYDNRTAASLLIGPQNILNARIGATYGFNQINGVEDQNGDRSVINSKSSYGAAWGVNWTFLPKTELFLDGGYQQTAWDLDNLETLEGTCSRDSFKDQVACEGAGEVWTECTENCFVAISDSNSWNSVVGINGQITSKTLLKVSLGYGRGIYGDGTEGSSTSDASVDDFREGLRSYVGFSYYPTSNQQMVLVFQRSFQDVYFTNYSVYNSIEAGYSVMMMNRVQLNSKFTYRQDNYEGPVDRTDSRMSANLGTNVMVQKFISIGAGGTWRRLLSASQPSLEYDDVSVNLSLKLGY
jgi:hypothetical protein